MLYQITRFVLTLYFGIYHRLSVYGRENIPSGRHVILASNHASYLDPPVVGLAFYPRRLRFIAWDKLFRVPLLGPFLYAMGSVPVSPENKNSSGALLKMVIGFLEKKWDVFICPEGHRTEDGNLQPLEGGVSILSLKTGCPVVPVWAGGTYRALAPHMKFPRPRKITVTFGKAIDPLSFPPDMNDKEKRRFILESLEAFYKEMDEKDRAMYPRS